MTDALEKHHGTVSIGGRTITNLRFADDIDGLQALTLDCGNHWPGGPVNQEIHWPPKKLTGPLPKTCNDPNVFAAGIYYFTREVAHFCTLGLYITKNEYELTLPSEFCQFPV